MDGDEGSTADREQTKNDESTLLELVPFVKHPINGSLIWGIPGSEWGKARERPPSREEIETGEFEKKHYRWDKEQLGLFSITETL